MTLRKVAVTNLEHVEAEAGRSAAAGLVKRWWAAELDQADFNVWVGAWPGYKDWPGGWPLADASLGALVRADSSVLKHIGLNIDHRRVSEFEELLVGAPGGVWPFKRLTLREPQEHERKRHPQQVFYLEDGLHRGLAIASLSVSRRIVLAPVQVFFGEI